MRLGLLNSWSQATVTPMVGAEEVGLRMFFGALDGKDLEFTPSGV